MGLFGFFKKKEKVMRYNVLFALYSPGVDLSGTFYNVLNAPDSQIRLGQYYNVLTRDGVESILTSEQVDVAFIPDIFSDGNRVGKGTLNKLISLSKKTQFYLVMTEGMGEPGGVKARKNKRLKELYTEGFYNVIFGEDCRYDYLRDLIALPGGRKQEEAYIYYGMEKEADIPAPKGYAGGTEPAPVSQQEEVQDMQEVPQQLDPETFEPKKTKTYEESVPERNPIPSGEPLQQDNKAGLNADRAVRNNVEQNKRVSEEQPQRRGERLNTHPDAHRNGRQRVVQQEQPVRDYNERAEDRQERVPSYDPSDNSNLPMVGNFSTPVSFNRATPVSTNVHLDFCINQHTAIITFPEDYDVTQCTNRWAILTFIGGM